MVSSLLGTPKLLSEAVAFLTQTKAVRQVVLVPRTSWVGQTSSLGPLKTRQELNLYILETVSEKRKKKNLMKEKAELGEINLINF